MKNLVCKTLIAALILSSGAATATAAEREKGDWQTLFDGKSTASWRSYGKSDFPRSGWVVDDGTLHLLPNGNGGDIITLAQFNDFELQWEWRTAVKANNGIKYLVTEARPKAPGQEYQM